eukprot:CAMPEP_0170545174 /NCGR_PEP_ID=MMETSP0211-20121228/3658_1 /TAXON_ID=311385 /ORGANISM="Pseudokeronopsis sp., Strain OXSARD2" /LENGTH=186 /DNA_ID=CAMNT_0010849003 /DNA_START=239 /DNA_END=799 /DNA_ORIENTATION=-
MMVSYDEFNGDHEELLLSLYIKAFNYDTPGFAPPERLLTSEWEELGFQSNNPRTDFRGAGLLGLKCLKYLHKNYHLDFEAMRKANKEKNFFFAIASLNVSHHLQVYLYLNKDPVMPNMKTKLAGRVEFKHFCRLNSKYKRTFFELYSVYMKITFKIWNKEILKGEAKDDRLVNFNLILEEGKDMLS